MTVTIFISFYLLDFANHLIYYTRKEVTYELLTHEYNYWRWRMSQLKSKYRLILSEHLYIFSKGEFTDGLLQAQERGEVRLITLEDLYK